jgi:hypothetical protein
MLSVSLFVIRHLSLSACTRAFFVDCFDHTVIGCGPAIADALRTQ